MKTYGYVRVSTREQNEDRQMCKSGNVRPGVPYYSDLYDVSIINFPTKGHWRSPSKLSYITSGLDWFRDNYEELGITSVSVLYSDPHGNSDRLHIC